MEAATKIGVKPREKIIIMMYVFSYKMTFQKYKTGKLNELVPSTRNKLYVALSRARGNVYLINEETIK